MSLAITRYIAKRKKHDIRNDDESQSSFFVPLVRTASSTSHPIDAALPCSHSNSHSHTKSKKNTGMAMVTPQPSAVKLREASSNDSDFDSYISLSSISRDSDTGQIDSSVLTSDSSSEPNATAPATVPATASSPSKSPSSSFMPNFCDESGDEWGQFTDFDDEGQDSFGNRINLDDPFMSINKTIMKRRGDKFSFPKLSQLQEEDEYENDCEEGDE
jgi:hypothetical protein